MAVSSKVTTEFSGTDTTTSSRSASSGRTARSNVVQEAASSRTANSKQSETGKNSTTGSVVRKTGPRRQSVVKEAAVSVTETTAPDTTQKQITRSDFGVQFSFALKITSPPVPGKTLQIA